MHKKAIELSLNFIVILIISIIIFGFGVNFISKLSKEATELQELTWSELDERIGNLVCEGSDRVCVGVERKTIPRTKFDVFGVKILNILDNKNFDIIVSPSNPIGYKKDKTPITNPPLLVNPALPRSIEIEKNEERTIGIGIQVPANAVPGTYIFDVRIEAPPGISYSQVQKLYVDVP